jgi:flagellar export protein FliJ
VRGLRLLARLARHDLVERRRRLGTAERRVSALAEQERRVENSLREEQVRVRDDWTRLAAAYPTYQSIALARRKAVRGALAEAETALDRARDALCEAFAGHARLETLVRQAEHRQALDARRREQAGLDEIAGQRARRRATS